MPMVMRGTNPDESPSSPTAGNSDKDDRRREPRYIPAKRAAFLGWWEGPSYETTEAWIESLSCSGAALLVHDFPPGKRPVWLCLVGSQPSDWFAGNVVGASPAGGAGTVVRIALKDSLPYDIFKTIGWGFPDA
jgi:hypothetical protein